nr:CHRD domain-containing protein [uncultured Acetobacter sp.]
MTLPGKSVFGALLAVGLLGAVAEPACAQRSMMFSGTFAAEHNAPAGVQGRVVALYYSGAHVLRYTVTWSGLSGPITIAHLHGPALPGKDGPPMATVRGPYKSPLSGGVMLSAEQEQDLLAGRVYLNLHTKDYPNGEARAWLVKGE